MATIVRRRRGTAGQPVDVVRSWLDPSIEVRPVAGQSPQTQDWAGTRVGCRR